jgi:HAD superfamily hydrolase (TIGR01509 family)
VEAINHFYSEYRKDVWFEKDLRSTLKAVRRRGYKVGVVSNSYYYDEVMENCFKVANINDLIDGFTFSYSLRTAKPRSEIFECALQKLGVEPSEAARVGDSLSSDIEPAMQLGMTGIWYNPDNKRAHGETVPDYTIETIGTLQSLLPLR